MTKVDVYQDIAGGWRWRLVARNGRILADSAESYIDENNAVWTIFQETPGGGWSSWIGPGFAGSVPMLQLAAAQQNNGCVQLWGIDSNLAVKTIAQTSPGGGWNSWSP